ncbi:uncharacterized protein LOC135109951 [Scylla paramamosain]|uniref:uncharacterized protein LOC135109951 n=1 Tax=Scylla paramamosain TaxID=85552 RepID=UPI003082B5AE
MNTETKASVTSPDLYSTFIIHDVGASSLLRTGNVMPDAALGHEREMFITSSIVCEETDEEFNQETGENTQVTIIISDTSAADKNGGVSLIPSHTHLDANPAPWSDPHFLRRCLKQCLKLTFPDKTDVCCFLCPDTCKSFIGLRKHLRETHNLSHGITQLPNLPAECISETAKEIRKLDCKCSAFICATCEVTFPHLLRLVQHVLLDHPTRCGDFTFFAEQQQKSCLEKCPRCTVLDKLCRVDYDLFVRVLLECMECCDEECRTLLLSWPLAHYAEPCEWCAKEEDKAKEHPGDSPGTHGAEREVVCYRIKQEHFDKFSQKSVTSECICPLMKCPECPKTVANYADLRKHVRQNNHSNWHDLRLMWEKYKTIKENCPVCPKHSYHMYILCPHCPHLDFDSERDAQTHMNFHHNTQDGDKLHGVCTCCNYFLCLKCNTSYPTPQSLHRHMRQMQHETPENLAAIPAMIQDSIRSREGCSHCSLQGSLIASVSLQKEEKCSCRWAECSTCKTSFRRVGGLLDHTLRAKHPMSARDIRKEREKLASSMITCQRCCIETNKYCALCHHKENFMYTHLRTFHQDCQIMLLRDDCGNVLEEHHAGGSDCRHLARYECSVCNVCHPRVNDLLCHVRRQHPQCHFTLVCLNLNEDRQQVKNLTGCENLMLLSVVDKKL